MDENTKQDLDRRAFLGTAGAAGLMILKPQLVRGSQANSAVRVGLLGCGGRGTADATSIALNGPARIVALADLFEDRLLTAKDHFDTVANMPAAQIVAFPGVATGAAGGAGACDSPPMATGVAAPRLVAGAIAATWLA